MKRLALLVTVLALVAAPAFAFDPVIDHGSDIWQTKPNGTTVVKFEADPLPADFFCTGSEPFAGRIVMGGVPIHTDPAGALGPTDTIVQRLDDAVFDEHGVAVTRLQVSAIQLHSVQPFRTACGAFDVSVSLADGEQPMGSMRIVRQGADFGYYDADVALNVRIAFSPVDKDGPALEVVRNIDFPSKRNFWTTQPGEGGVQYNGFVRVDTDANGQADTFVPGTSSNFAPGWFGGFDRGGILHRAAGSRDGVEVSGSLKGTPSRPLHLEPNTDIRTLASGVSLQEPTATLPSIDCSLSTCHCEYDGDHCQVATTTTINAQ